MMNLQRTKNMRSILVSLFFVLSLPVGYVWGDTYRELRKAAIPQDKYEELEKAATGCKDRPAVEGGIYLQKDLLWQVLCFKQGEEGKIAFQAVIDAELNGTGEFGDRDLSEYHPFNQDGKKYLSSSKTRSRGRGLACGDMCYWDIGKWFLKLPVEITIMALYNPKKIDDPQKLEFKKSSLPKAVNAIKAHINRGRTVRVGVLWDVKPKTLNKNGRINDNPEGTHYVLIVGYGEYKKKTVFLYADTYAWGTTMKYGKKDVQFLGLLEYDGVALKGRTQPNWRIYGAPTKGP